MDIGAPEIVIVLLVVLLVFGPRKVPQLARSIGAAIHELRAGARSDTASNDTSSRRENEQ